jgi:hypothetical protein
MENRRFDTDARLATAEARNAELMEVTGAGHHAALNKQTPANPGDNGMM